MYTRRPSSFVVPFELGPGAAYSVEQKTAPGAFQTDRFWLEADGPILLTHLTIAGNSLIDGSGVLLHVPGGAPQPFDLVEPVQLYGNGGVSAGVKNLQMSSARASLHFPFAEEAPPKKRAPRKSAHVPGSGARCLITLAALDVPPGKRRTVEFQCYQPSRVTRYIVVSTGRGRLEEVSVGYDVLNDDPIALVRGTSEVFELPRAVNPASVLSTLRVENTGVTTASYCVVFPGMPWRQSLAAATNPEPEGGRSGRPDQSP